MIQPIRAILFDFNGVVASRDVAGAVDAAHSVLHFFTVPPEAVLTRLLPAHPLSPAVDLGQATNVDRWEALRREVWRGPRHVWEEWWRAFDASYRMPDGTADLLRQLRGDYRLGLLTDNDAGFRARLEGWPDIATHFDVVVISAEEGIKKPSPHIFERAVGRLGSTYGTTAFLETMCRTSWPRRRWDCVRSVCNPSLTCGQTCMRCLTKRPRVPVPVKGWVSDAR